MKIACLVTVCAALFSTLRIIEALHSGRQPQSKDHQLEVKTKNVTLPNKVKPVTVPNRTILPPQSNQSNVYLNGTQKKSRKTRQNDPPSIRQRASRRLKRGRSRRQLQRLSTRSLNVGSTYEVDDNHIETIQAPEMFEDGAIHIEPLYRVTKKKGFLDSLIDVLRRAVNPPKSHLGPLIGPFHFPGIGDKVYIRLLEPVHSNHLQIRLITELPFTDIESSFNKNLYPLTAIVDNSGYVTLDHQPHILTTDILSNPLLPHEQLQPHFISTGSLHAAGSNLVPVAKLPPVAAVPNQLDTTLVKNRLGDDTHTSRAFRVNSLYGDGRRHPVIMQTIMKRPRYRQQGFRKSAKFRNASRPRGNSIRTDQVFASTQLKNVKGDEEKTESQVIREVKFEEVPFYPYHPNLYAGKTNSEQNVSDDDASKSVKTSESSEHWSPAYTFNIDDSSLRQVTRNSRVAPKDTSTSTPLPDNGAIRIITPPDLVPTRFPYLLNNYSFDGIDDSNRKINSVRSKLTVNSFKPNVSTEETKDNKDYRYARNGTVKIPRWSVPFSSNQSWEPVKLRTTKTIELITAPSLFEKRMKDLRDRINATNRLIEAYKKLPSISRNIKVQNKSVTNNVPVHNSTTSSKESKTNASTECPNNKCEESRLEDGSESEEYEYIVEPVFDDDYYDDDLEENNTTQAPKESPIVTTTLKTTLSGMTISNTTKRPNSQAGNFTTREAELKKNTTSSRKV